MLHLGPGTVGVAKTGGRNMFYSVLSAKTRCRGLDWADVWYINTPWLSLSNRLITDVSLTVFYTCFDSVLGLYLIGHPGIHYTNKPTIYHLVTLGGAIPLASFMLHIFPKMLKCFKKNIFVFGQGFFRGPTVAHGWTPLHTLTITSRWADCIRHTL